MLFHHYANTHGHINKPPAKVNERVLVVFFGSAVSLLVACLLLHQALGNQFDLEAMEHCSAQACLVDLSRTAKLDN